MLLSRAMRLRSHELRLDQYDTDKIPNRYLQYYDPFLEQLIDQPIRLLELGVFRGGSLQLWQDYFPYGLIVGVDGQLPKDVIKGDRIRAFQGSQADRGFL